MADIRFYHLTKSTLEQVLPDLLEKTLQRDLRAVVMAGSDERVEELTQHLWSYNQDRFLPHGSAKDGHAALQPIWITTEDECPNGAKVLFLTDGSSSKVIADYDIVCEIFDGHYDLAVQEARKRWKSYKAQGHEIAYWQQSESGWEKKA